jgi:hypothetical protein
MLQMQDLCKLIGGSKGRRSQSINHTHVWPNCIFEKSDREMMRSLIMTAHSITDDEDDASMEGVPQTFIMKSDHHPN